MWPHPRKGHKKPPRGLRKYTFLAKLQRPRNSSMTVKLQNVLDAYIFVSTFGFLGTMLVCTGDGLANNF